MLQSTPYPSPPNSQVEYMESHAATVARSLLASAWQVVEQPPPPTLREILNAYKSKGDGDRDMLLAMLNAKSAEDQRIASIATLHHKLLDVHGSPRSPNYDHVAPFGQPGVSAPYPQPSTSHFIHSPSLPKISPSASPRDVTLPSIHASQNPRKRTRTSRSPPPLIRRHSGHSEQTVAPLDQLPPSPPFSSPGRSTQCPELAAHPPRDAMAIGSLLSSGSCPHDADSEWPSRTSSEREREGYRKQTKVSG
ncbi:hypothetical protein K439DRAFT_1659130 [Ramaria rubella]|nr:hypothetical protein K439DRAFT_1659130 [Ramaria rubella]